MRTDEEALTRQLDTLSASLKERCHFHSSTYMTGAWLPAVLRRTILLGSSIPDMPPLDMRCCMARRGEVLM